MAPPVREKTVGKSTVRVVREVNDFAGVVLREDGSRTVLRGSNLEILWNQLLKEASKGSPDYFGFEGARERFLHFFPNGFTSRGYKQKEGDYKRAVERWGELELNDGHYRCPRCGEFELLFGRSMGMFFD